MKALNLISTKLLSAIGLLALFSFVFIPQDKVYPMSDLDLLPTWTDCADDQDNAMRIQCLYSGVRKHVVEHLEYPDEAKEALKEGKVMLKMIVFANGSIGEIRLARKLGDDSASTSLEEEAVRVMSSLPAVIPAEKDGEKVSTELILPVHFELN